MTDSICISPIDGREVARRPQLSDGALAKVVASARKAQDAWSHVPIVERAAIMLRFLEAMHAMNEEIVPELALQMGRPIRYGGELNSFTERVRGMVSIAQEALAPLPAPDQRPGCERYIKRIPVGVVLAIAPWNYPYLTAVNTVVPALIAGNAVILKHAAQTLLVGERFAAAMDKAGLPPDLFANVVLSHEQTLRLIAAGAVNHINFTGSVSAGRAIEQAAAGTFTSVGLELGGKDPAYVRADAPLEQAIESLVDGAFFNSGQSCCAIERIYVHESQYDAFIEGFLALTAQYRLGDPLEAETTLGPMASQRLANSVRAQINEALAQGARLPLSPRLFPAAREERTFVAPHVLTHVDHSMRVMVEETFGPVVGIMKVCCDDEAISLMNDSQYGLSASLWSTDLDMARTLGDRLETGTVFLNRCDYIDPGLVWTGIKHTGRGASLSVLGYHILTRPKSYHLRYHS